MKVSLTSATKQIVITFDKEVKLRDLKNSSCLESGNKTNCYYF